jgi:hypothetical protein
MEIRAQDSPADAAFEPQDKAIIDFALNLMLDLVLARCVPYLIKFCRAVLGPPWPNTVCG